MSSIPKEERELEEQEDSAFHPPGAKKALWAAVWGAAVVRMIYKETPFGDVKYRQVLARDAGPFVRDVIEEAAFIADLAADAAEEYGLLFRYELTEQQRVPLNRKEAGKHIWPNLRQKKKK